MILIILFMIFKRKLFVWSYSFEFEWKTVTTVIFLWIWKETPSVMKFRGSSGELQEKFWWLEKLFARSYSFEFGKKLFEWSCSIEFERKRLVQWCSAEVEENFRKVQEKLFARSYSFEFERKRLVLWSSGISGEVEVKLMIREVSPQNLAPKVRGQTIGSSFPLWWEACELPLLYGVEGIFLSWNRETIEYYITSVVLRERDFPFVK